jgi:hypothetical protein
MEPLILKIRDYYNILKDHPKKENMAKLWPCIDSDIHSACMRGMIVPYSAREGLANLYLAANGKIALSKLAKYSIIESLGLVAESAGNTFFAKDASIDNLVIDLRENIAIKSIKKISVFDEFAIYEHADLFISNEYFTYLLLNGNGRFIGFSYVFGRAKETKN